MEKSLEKAIRGLSMRMRQLKAVQEDQAYTDELSDREAMILGMLHDRGKMSVSQIASAEATVSESTISTTITKLWRNKKMVSKMVSPESQRVTIVELTEKGRQTIEIIIKQRTERFKSLLKAIQVTDGEKQVLIDVCTRAVKFMDSRFGLNDKRDDSDT